MVKKLEVRLIKDKGDKSTTDKGILFNIPLRLIIVGKTGGGKTNLLTALLTQEEFYLKDFRGRNIYLFSPMINDYKLEYLVDKKNIPDLNIYTEFDNELLRALYDKLTEEFETEMLLAKKVSNKLIILDDLSFDGSLKRGLYNMVQKIFCNGRKHNISIIITSQYYTHISPVCRTNCSGAILFTMNDRQMDTIADENNYMDSKKEFKQFLKTHLKEKHDFIAINYSNSRDKGLYLSKNFEKIA
jgi:hypothetical protein